MDNVNHPAHYDTGRFESIDVMVETQGVDAVKNFCICNAFKYIYRHRRKNGLEDIKKAIKILKENGATEIFIFGSIADGKFHENSDIDIAVRGINETIFYKVASKLMAELDNNFDLVDLDDEENRFSQMLIQIGGLLKVG